MNNSIVMILLLGTLLMLLVAPFSALAMLMLVVFISAFSWMFWTLVRTLFRGDTQKG